MRDDFRGARVHFVGVGGSGMCGLAANLLRRGAIVSGTDRSESPAIARLVSGGARISFQQAAASVPSDVQIVVASAAVPHDHPEIVEARRRGIDVQKYAQFLGRVMDQYQGIAISGTHGKSTTTAWTTYTLRRAGLDPSFVIGADVDQLGGGSGVGDGRFFVAEACEFDRSFHNLRPRFAAILNIEEDHLDYYSGIGEIVDSFAHFAAGVGESGLALLNGNDANCREIARRLGVPVETFGLGETETWQGVELQLKDGRYEFTVLRRGLRLGTVALGLPGRHNVMNALAVVALATHCGAAWPVIQESLFEFGGARRRLETRGQVRGVLVVDDYAHHPTEIRATLRAARERFAPRRIWCVFQPHQHSRTRFLLEEFAKSFDLADRVIVPRIYFVRDTQRDKELVCAEDLVARIRAGGIEAEYHAEFAAIVDTLAQHAEPGDLVLTMGAGDIWKVADELVARLRADLPG